MSKSQCNQILEHLQAGHTLTGLEALNLCGTMYLPRRIADLKERGHHIETEPAGIPGHPNVERYFMPEHRKGTQRTFCDTGAGRY